MSPEVARRLIEAWNRDTYAYHAIKLGLLDQGIVPTNELVKREVGLAYMPFTIRAMPFLGRYMSIAADMLFAGKPESMVVAFMVKTNASRPTRRIKPKPIINESYEIFNHRKRDKRYDWKTVK